MSITTPEEKPTELSVSESDESVQNFTKATTLVYLKLLAEYDDPHKIEESISGKMTSAFSEISSELNRQYQAKRTILKNINDTALVLLHNLMNAEDPLLHEHIKEYLSDALTAAGISKDGTE